MLTADTLHGVYSFVPLPWDEDYRLDEAVLRHDLDYLCGTGLHGLYTTDTSGEFYALEYAEFQRVVGIVTEVAGAAGMPVQVGCTWSDTRGALRRAEHAVRCGAAAVRFAFPFWQQLSVAECLRFTVELAAVCGDVPLVHYNTPRCKVVFGVAEYRQAVDLAPTLIGTKTPLHDPIELAGLIEGVPELSHFVGEYVFAPALAAGARGIYSFLGATNPRLALEWYDACRAGRWQRALQIQTAINRWKVLVKSRWSCTGDAAINKLDAIVNPNIRCSPRVRPPYTAGSADDVAFARRWAAAHFPDLLQL